MNLPLATVTLLAALTAPSASYGSPRLLEPIAVTGQRYLGMTTAQSLVEVGFKSRLLLSDSGHVAFTGRIDSPEFDFTLASVFTTSSNGTILLAANGLEIANTGMIAGGIGLSAIGTHGETHFSVGLPDIYMGVNRYIFRSESGLEENNYKFPSQVEIDGQLRMVSPVSATARDNAESLAIFVSVSRHGEGSDSSIWRVNEGEEPQFVAASSRSLPGLPQSVTANLVYGQQLNNREDIVFMADFTRPGAFTIGSGIWRQSAAGDLSPIIISSDPIPGSAEISTTSYRLPTFRIFPRYKLADSGHMAFLAAAGPDIPSSNQTNLLLRELNGEIEEISSVIIPPADQLFSSHFGFAPFSMNNSGDLAWYSQTAAGSISLQTLLQSSLATIAQTGTALPGLNERSTLINFASTPTINSAGQVAFAAQVDDGHTGVWVGDTDSISLVALEGQEVSLGNGQYGVLDTIQLPVAFYMDPLPEMPFNNQGQVAFFGVVSTQDGNSHQTIFLSTPISVPEPSTLLMFAASMLPLGFLRVYLRSPVAFFETPCYSSCYR